MYNKLHLTIYNCTNWYQRSVYQIPNFSTPNSAIHPDHLSQNTISIFPSLLFNLTFIPITSHFHHHKHSAFMDPPIINETSFSAANPSSYTLTGIWPFSSVNNARIEDLGLKMSTLIAPNWDPNSTRDEESTVTEYSGGGGRKRRDANFEDESSKIVSTSSAIDLNKLNDKRMKISGSDEPGGSKTDQERSSGSGGKAPAGQTLKPSEPPKDYIHVRARRGQATDRHSLAERARREKISERMKILQDLVPGCNKVIGKALVLDEIINYIQSLQHQVEFLSMKLEAVNTRMASPVEGFPTKDLGPQPLDATGLLYGSQTSRPFGHESQPEWLHMQLGSNFGRMT